MTKKEKREEAIEILISTDDDLIQIKDGQLEQLKEMLFYTLKRNSQHGYSPYEAIRTIEKIQQGLEDNAEYIRDAVKDL